MVQGLNGIPTFSGNVTKSQFDPGVVPTFDASFVIKVRKAYPSPAPRLATDKVILTKVQAETSTFDDKVSVQFHKLRY